MKSGRPRSSLFALVAGASCTVLVQGCGGDVSLGTIARTGGAPGSGGTGITTGVGGVVGSGGVAGAGGSGAGQADAANADGPKGGAGGTSTIDAPVTTGGQTASGGVAGTTSSGGKTGTGGGTGMGGATGTGGGSGARCGTIAGLACPAGYFCDLASQCNTISDAAGICVLQGSSLGCTDVYNPVCGCNGQTYPSDCDRQIAGVLKMSDGVCAGGTGGKTSTGGATGVGGGTGTGGATGTGGNTSNVCGGDAALTCPSGKYCDLDSKCGQIADASGTCKLTGDIGCTADVNPVCGCDGKTYSNDCMRNVTGVLKASDGACPGTDGGTSSYPTAWLAWQAPGGGAGTGPAVVVGGSGFIDTWSNVAYFSPETPPSSATASSSLTRAQTDDLFARLASVSFASLPHSTSNWAECQSIFYYRPCQGCSAATLSYIFPEQASPEMDSVWLWFDQVLGATTNTNPRNYCNFK